MQTGITPYCPGGGEGRGGERGERAESDSHGPKELHVRHDHAQQAHGVESREQALKCGVDGMNVCVYAYVPDAACIYTCIYICLYVCMCICGEAAITSCSVEWGYICVYLYLLVEWMVRSRTGPAVWSGGMDDDVPVC